MHAGFVFELFEYYRLLFLSDTIISLAQLCWTALGDRFDQTKTRWPSAELPNCPINGRDICSRGGYQSTAPATEIVSDVNWTHAFGFLLICHGERLYRNDQRRRLRPRACGTGAVTTKV